MSVYIDLYVLINFSMDLLCLMTVGSLLHRRIRRLRAILAAVLGSLYAAASLLLGLDGVLGFVCDAGFAILLCTIAFYTRGEKPRTTLKSAAVFVLVSMLLGGIMTGLYSLLNRLHLPLETLQGDGLSVWIFALLTAVAGVATARGGAFLGFSKKTTHVTVNAVLFGRTIELCAMVDSGNLLRDPISGKRVIVADLERLERVLPPDLVNAFRQGTQLGWLSTYENAKHARPIPTQSATGQSILLALVPDSLTLTVENETYPADYLIAPSPLGSSAQGFDAVISLH